MIETFTGICSLKVAGYVGLASWLYSIAFALVEGLSLTGPFISAILGALTILIPAYLLDRRERRKHEDELVKMRQEGVDETADSVLKYNTERERRLDQIAMHLREEEREFMNRQITLSRERSHILSNGYSKLVLLNFRQQQWIRENGGKLPPELYSDQIQSNVLRQLEDLEDRQQQLKMPEKEKEC